MKSIYNTITLFITRDNIASIEDSISRTGDNIACTEDNIACIGEKIARTGGNIEIKRRSWVNLVELHLNSNGNDYQSKDYWVLIVWSTYSLMIYN